MSIFGKMYINEAKVRASNKVAKEKQFKFSIRKIKDIVDSIEYENERFIKPEFLDYNDGDFKNLLNDWANDKSKFISICTFNTKDSGYNEKALDFIINQYNELKKRNPTILGSLKKSVGKYGSEAEILYSVIV